MIGHPSFATHILLNSLKPTTRRALQIKNLREIQKMKKNIGFFAPGLYISNEYAAATKKLLIERNIR